MMSSEEESPADQKKNPYLRIKTVTIDNYQGEARSKASCPL